MNNPNPFVPKGSLLEQQSQRRFRLKFAVGCVLAVSVTGLVAMLIGGCKREQPAVDASTPPVVDTSSNLTPVVDTSSNTTPPMVTSNTAYTPPPYTPPQPPVPQPPVPAVDTGGTEYVVVAGDTLAKIAKAHGVTLKALEAANPGVDPKKLKIKQKLVVPASTKSADVSSPATSGVADAGGELYTIKSGDTLAKIAKAHGTTVKAIQAENNLSTTKILVGHKLKIPARAEAAAPAPAPAPAVDTTAAPALPPVTAPAPPAPAPGK
jgi:LysM repeat protein